MQDKEILKYIMGLGLEELIKRSGGNLADFVAGNNIQPTYDENPVPEDLKPQGTSFDNERAARMARSE